MNFLFRFCLICSVAWSLMSSAYAETFTVIAYQNANPPYNIRNLDNINGHSGIFVDIFARIEQLSDDKFEFRFYPVSRALREFDHGLVDIEPGINPSWRQHRKQPGLYSIEYAKSTEVFLFNPGKRVSVKKPIYLSGKTLGVVRGYVYPMLTEAFDSGLIKRVDNVSEFYLLKQLAAKRYDQILIGYDTALYYKKHHPKYQQFEVGDAVSVLSVHMRVHPSKAHLLERLNPILRQMVANGDIEKIYAKYR